ncbi:MAG: (Fe-S)-binding protein [Acidobacteriota bacterium]
MTDLAQVVKQTRAWACYDCGKCTATCPISRVTGTYSPRGMVLAAVLGRRDEIVHDAALYQCLTCRMCDRRCPAEVRYTDLVQKLRELAHRDGFEHECPHGGALLSTMRIMAAGTTRQARLGWLTDRFRTETTKGDVFYWTGCSMYYDAFFPQLDVKTLDGTRAAILLMNRAGIQPIVSPDERCCGHDLLWNGDRSNFELLARFNVKLVEDSGAKVLVTSCAECLRTWKIDYSPYFKGKPPRIVHFTELLGELMDRLKFKAEGRQKVTFQDPCRMGRHLGIYQPPRDVLAAVPGVEIVEMQRAEAVAVCCAGGTWSSCDWASKQIQVERLREAKATGAGILATACPKCQIHFRCTMKDHKRRQEIEMEIRDVAELAAAALA